MNICTTVACATCYRCIMPKTSIKKLASNKKYNDKATDTITVRLQKKDIVNKDSIRIWAENANMSVNKYVITAIFEKRERDEKTIK